MNNPNKVKVDNEIYSINTDFRVALECNRIATDCNINDYERVLAILYTLYGEKGLDNPEHYNKLLELAQKYLCCGKELEKGIEPDMDYEQDEGYIKSSFKQDYQYNPYELKFLHWWDFFNDLNNLSNSELGSCCVLNRIRNLRNYDTSTIKDGKERAKVEKAKQQVALKKKEKPLTDKQKESIERFNKLAGLS